MITDIIDPYGTPTHSIPCQICRDEVDFKLHEEWAIFRIESSKRSKTGLMNKLGLSEVRSNGSRLDLPSLEDEQLCSNGHAVKIEYTTHRLLEDEEILKMSEQDPEINCPECDRTIDRLPEYIKKDEDIFVIKSLDTTSLGSTRFPAELRDSRNDKSIEYKRTLNCCCEIYYIYEQAEEFIKRKSL